MEIKRLLLALVSVLLIIGLTGCERPASTPPAGAATPALEEGEFPIPGVTDDVMGQLEIIATQTAIAMQGGGVTPEAPAGTPADVTQATPEATPAVEEQPTTAPQAAAATPAATAVPVAVATPGIPTSYTLQKGEHPYCIARRFNVNPDEMLRISGLGRGDNYSPGTVLKIPQTGNTFPAARSLRSHPTTYTVSSGDTIFSIACQFGDVDPYAIATANGLASPYKIENGQSLHIP